MPVSEADVIVRLAARGDGVTQDGRFVPLTAPGDRILSSGEIVQGPHHQAPPCRHFPECGGCQLQHVADSAYAGFLHDRIASALVAQGAVVPEILPAHISPPRRRRRASLRWRRCAPCSASFRRPRLA
jgi:23S rRNA (uracil1939-C5)-methyltransferase